MRKNEALAKLRRGGVISGPMLIFESPDLAEQVAHLGFDFVWLDWQHGQYTELTLNNAIARFLPVASSPIVRVKGHEPGTINRVLDVGAMGVVVPYVQNADQARLAVSAAYYPPKGIRSGGGARLGLLADGAADYYANANPEIMMVVMVETETAIGRIEEIMRVPGVDVALIGPGRPDDRRQGQRPRRRRARAPRAGSGRRREAHRHGRRLRLRLERRGGDAHRPGLPLHQLPLRLRHPAGRVPAAA